MSKTKIFTGVITGITAGIILGLLFAPDKGSEIRKKIVKKGNDLKDGLQSKLSGLAGNIEDEYNNAAEAVTKKYDEGKNLAFKAGKDLSSLKADTKHLLS